MLPPLFSRFLNRYCSSNSLSSTSERSICQNSENQGILKKSLFDRFSKFSKFCQFLQWSLYKIDFSNLPAHIRVSRVFLYEVLGEYFLVERCQLELNLPGESDLAIKRALSAVVFEYSRKYRFLAYFEKLDLANAPPRLPPKWILTHGTGPILEASESIL